MKTLSSINWIHRDEQTPADGQSIVVSTNYSFVTEGTYLKRHDLVDYADGRRIEWYDVVGWIPTEDFPYAKEEDFK